MQNEATKGRRWSPFQTPACSFSLLRAGPKRGRHAYDGHGNVRLLTDESGAVTDRYHYEAFGALIGTEGATANAHLYCGERFDSTIGHYYLRARTMNPLTGRFWTMDAEGYRKGQTFY